MVGFSYMGERATEYLRFSGGEPMMKDMVGDYGMKQKKAVSVPPKLKKKKKKRGVVDMVMP